MIKQVAFMLTLAGVAAIAVGCSNSSGQSPLQQEMSRLWVECKAQPDNNNLSCLEMRQLHRENPGVVNPAAEANADKLIRQSELITIEGKEVLDKMDKELAEFCKGNAKAQSDRSLCP